MQNTETAERKAIPDRRRENSREDAEYRRVNLLV